MELEIKVLSRGYFTKKQLEYLFTVKGIKLPLPKKGQYVTFPVNQVERALGLAIGDYERFSKTAQKGTYGQIMYMHEICEIIKNDLPAPV
jgi:hypothetical protein